MGKPRFKSVRLREILAGISAGKLAALFKNTERPWRRRHQELVAASDQPLNVTRIRVRMPTGYVVLLADPQNIIDRIRNNRMLIISRVT